MSRSRCLFLLLCAACLAGHLPVRAGEAPKPQLVLWAGHTTGITLLELSPDGKYLVSGSDDAVVLWNARTLEGLYTFLDLQPRFQFSPDSKTLALWHRNGEQIFLWDVATRSIRRTFSVAKGWTAQLSADFRILASPADDGKGILLRDGWAGGELGVLRGHEAQVQCARVSGGGGVLVTEDRRGVVIAWDVATRRPIRTVGLGTPFPEMVVSTNGRMVAWSNGTSSVTMWDTATSSSVRQLRASTEWLTVTGFSPDGRLLAACNWARDDSTFVWDTGRDSTPERLPKCRRAPRFSSDGRWLAWGGYGSVSLRDLASGRTIDLPFPDPISCQAFALDPARGWLWGAGEAKSICGWDVATRALRRHRQAGTGGYSQVGFVGEGTLLAYDNFGHIDQWRLNPPRLLRPIPSHVGWGNTLCVSPWARAVAFEAAGSLAVLTPGGGVPALFRQDRTFAWATVSADGLVQTGVRKDGTVVQWSPSGGVKVMCMLPSADLVSATCSPDGSTAILTYGRHVSAYEIATGRLMWQNEIPGSAGIALSPDNQSFALCRSDDTTTIRDLQTGAVRRQIPGWMSSAVFSPDGTILALAGYRQAVLFSVRTWEKIATLPVSEFAWDVAFSADGKTLAVATSQGTLRLFEVTTKQVTATLYSLNGGYDWAAAIPQGYYDASLGGLRALRWRIGNTLYPPEQFEARFRRPDLVAKALRGEPLPADLPTLALDRVPPAVAVETPGVGDTASGYSVPVRVTVRPGAESATIKKVELRVNGRLADLGRAGSVQVAARGKGLDGSLAALGRMVVARPAAATGERALVLDAAVSFLPCEEEVRLMATAYDDQELRGDSEILVVKRRGAPARRGNLYLLAVGVSEYANPAYNLRFAEADATALARTLAGQQGRAFAAVQGRLLTNAQATREGVRAGLRWLQEAPAANDVALVLFSGHGVRDDAGKLFFVTREGRGEALAVTCLPWDEVDAALRQCPARQVVFLMDCCHAGAFGERQAESGSLAETLVKKAGVVVFASSQGGEESLENEQWGHGAFTRAVLDGLSGKADIFGTGAVNLSSLVAYVSEAVPALTGDRQHPWMPRAEQFDTRLRLAMLR